MILFIKLLLSHLLGDFLFQSRKWVKEEEEKNFRSAKLYFHAATHGLLAIVVIWELKNAGYALIIAITHAIIDGFAAIVRKWKNNPAYFVIDQVFHIAIILGVCWLIEKPVLLVSSKAIHKVWIIATAVFALTIPASVTIKTFISQWAPEEQKDNSLQNAGKYIGMLERIFVMTFVVTGHWEAIGFLIAAKSVFRFGDLKESKDRKLTEYILIGTLMSFGLALIVGLAARWALGI